MPNDEIDNPLETLHFEQGQEEAAPAAPDTPATPESESEESDAPAASSAPDPVAELRQQLQAEREERLKLQGQLEQLGRLPAAPSQPEPELDIEKIIDEHFQGASSEGLRAVFQALEQKYAKQYAPRTDFEQIRTAHAQSAIEMQEREVMESMVKDGVPEADVKEIRRRIHDDFRKNGKPRYQSPEEAFEREHRRLLLERQHKAADKAARNEDAVLNRQQKQATPQSAAPSGNGKVQLDTRAVRDEFIKKHRRKPSTFELIDEVAKRGG